jgi:hypothetical protein
MKLDDHLVVRWCRRSTRLLLSLRVIGQHTEFSDTLYNEGGRIWIWSCVANCPPPRGSLPQKTMVGESPGNLSMRSPYLVVEVAGGLPHGVPYSP